MPLLHKISYIHSFKKEKEINKCPNTFQLHLNSAALSVLKSIPYEKKAKQNQGRWAERIVERKGDCTNT